MKRAHVAAVGFSFVLVACVPASTPLAPAGAAGFTTEPSPASLGQPFTTDDGWTVRFEQLVLQGWVSSIPKEPRDFSSDASTFRWNARDRVEIFARAMSVGAWDLGIIVGRPLSEDPEDIITLGVAPEIVRRFERPADDGAAFGFPLPPMRAERGSPFIDRALPPSLVVVVTAEKAGRSIRLDIALSTDFTFDDSTRNTTIDVKADSLTTRPIQVNAERLFKVQRKENGAAPRLELDPFAAADADKDGILTVAELREVEVPCPECLQPAGTPLDETTPDDERKSSLLEVLRARARSLLVPVPR